MCFWCLGGRPPPPIDFNNQPWMYDPQYAHRPGSRVPHLANANQAPASGHAGGHTGDSAPMFTHMPASHGGRGGLANRGRGGSRGGFGGAGRGNFAGFEGPNIPMNPMNAAGGNQSGGNASGGGGQAPGMGMGMPSAPASSHHGHNPWEATPSEWAQASMASGSQAAGSVMGGNPNVYVPGSASMAGTVHPPPESVWESVNGDAEGDWVTPNDNLSQRGGALRGRGSMGRGQARRGGGVVTYAESVHGGGRTGGSKVGGRGGNVAGSKYHRSHYGRG